MAILSLNLDLRSMKLVIISAGIVAIISAIAANIHLVKLDDSIKVLMKTEMAFEDTIVDARGAKNKLKLLGKPRLIEAGINDLLESD